MTNSLNNQRGGIIAKMIFMPFILALMAGFFILGYSVGNYRAKSGVDNAASVSPEPETEQSLKLEDLTFYKTLTDSKSKTISIDLKPKAEPTAAPDRKPLEIQGEQTEQVEAGGRKSRVSNEASPPGSRYSLQVSSYQDKKMAEAEVKKLKQRGYSAALVASRVKGKGTWYRVKIGSFASRAAAEKKLQEIHAKTGIKAIVTTD